MISFFRFELTESKEGINAISGVCFRWATTYKRLFKHIFYHMVSKSYQKINTCLIITQKKSKQ